MEVDPNARPIVCKIMDWGRAKYDLAKKEKAAKRHEKVLEIKQVKFRPGIDDHDYGVKMRAVKRFFDEGDKVKVTLRFRGREMAHQELGYRLLERVKRETLDIAKVEVEPSMEGRQMVMILVPR